MGILLHKVLYMGGKLHNGICVAGERTKMIVITIAWDTLLNGLTFFLSLINKTKKKKMEIPKRKDTQMLGEVNITKTSPPTTVQGIYHLNIHNS